MNSKIKEQLEKQIRALYEPEIGELKDFEIINIEKISLNRYEFDSENRPVIIDDYWVDFKVRLDSPREYVDFKEVLSHVSLKRFIDDNIIVARIRLSHDTVVLNDVPFVKKINNKMKEYLDFISEKSEEFGLNPPKVSETYIENFLYEEKLFEESEDMTEISIVAYKLDWRARNLEWGLPDYKMWFPYYIIGNALVDKVMGDDFFNKKAAEGYTIMFLLNMDEELTSAIRGINKLTGEIAIVAMNGKIDPEELEPFYMMVYWQKRKNRVHMNLVKGW